MLVPTRDTVFSVNPKRTTAPPRASLLPGLGPSSTSPCPLLLPIPVTSRPQQPLCSISGCPPPPAFSPSATTPSRPHALEEVLLAIHSVPTAEALLGQLRLAVGAFQALAVPVPVQDLEDEPVHDVLVAAGAQRDVCGEAAPVSPR